MLFFLCCSVLRISESNAICFIESTRHYIALFKENAVGNNCMGDRRAIEMLASRVEKE